VIPVGDCIPWQFPLAFSGFSGQDHTGVITQLYLISILGDRHMTESASFTNSATSVGDGVAVELGEDKSWQDLANCLGVDPDLFFPERGASTREAKEVCRGCVVRDDCLEYALANGEKFGIWGGMSERERRRIRRQRALARAAAASAPARTTATA
jgi:WhiB family redox-sensing transcriptional regulator